MRKMNFLQGVGLSALMLSAQPAIAQQSPNAETAEEADTIIVTGIRGSLQNSQDRKRKADSVVEVVTTETLGQFSDQSVADAISRVPGVQIERNDDGRDGARVSIRGLGSEFVTTTLNGRSVFSGGAEGTRQLRSFSFDTLPSELFGEILVRKTPTADHIEAGIAGQVDVRTLDPLSTAPYNGKGHFVSLTGTYEDHSIAGDGYKFNGIAGWRNEDQTLGLYVAGLYGDTRFGAMGNEWEGVTTNATVNIAGTTHSNVRAPLAVSLDNIYDKHKRLGLAGAIAWQPSDSLKIKADAIYSRFDRDNFRSRLSFDTGATLNQPGAVFAAGGAEVVTDEYGNNNLLFADFSRVSFLPGDDILSNGAPRGIDLQARPLIYDNDTKTFMAGLNIEFKPTNRLTATIDGYISTVDFQQDLFISVFSAPYSNASFDARGTGASIYSIGAQPAFGIGAGVDGLRNHPFRDLVFGGFARTNDFTADHYGLAADFDYELDLGLLTTFEFGARYAKTDFARATNIGVIGNADTQADRDRIEAALFTGNVIDADFFGLPMLEYDLAGLRSVYANVFGANNIFDLDKRPIVDGSGTFGVVQKDLALYGELNLEDRSGLLPIRGNIGLRAIKSTYTAQGPNLVNNKAGTIKGGQGWQFLPSLNLTFDIKDNIQFRFGIGRSISAPEVEDLIRPVNVPVVICNPVTDINCPPEFLDASTGNPNLKPISAWTFDSSLEIYTPNNGSIIIGAFHKKINDFIRNDGYFTELPAPAGGTIYAEGELVPVFVQGPINFSNGKVTGLEFGFNQPLSFLPGLLSGFGTQFNYTYVKSSFDKDSGDAGLGFPGSSKHNVTAVLYYEKGPLSLRSAYTYRSKFLASLNAATATAPVDEAQFAEGWGQLDLSMRYQIRKGIDLRASVNDVLESSRRDFVGSQRAYRAFYQRGRTISAGITATF